MGAMKSTPVNAILAECNEQPLQFRRKLLAQKYIIKLKTRESTMIDKLNKLAIEDLTNKYWKIKNSPPLAEAVIDTKHLSVTYGNYKKLPMFNINYMQLIKKHRVIIPKYTESKQINKAILNSVLEDFVDKDITTLYTDGSRTINGVGCAVFIQTANQSLLYQLPKHSSIYTAELFAIQKAISWLISKKY